MVLILSAQIAVMSLDAPFDASIAVTGSETALPEMPEMLEKGAVPSVPRG
jgi:hypothetical protein